MISRNAKLTELTQPIVACMPQVVGTAGVTSSWYNFGKAYRCCVIIIAANTTTVTSSAITFNQAKDAAGTGSKALVTFGGLSLNGATPGSGNTNSVSYATSGPVDVNFNPTTSDLNTNGYATSSGTLGTVTSAGTLTPSSKNSDNQVYFVNILATDLDVNNGFEFLNVVVAQGVAQTVTVLLDFYPVRWEDAPMQTLLT